jgi:hypothetical protein
LNAKNVEYLIVGGYAVAFHGAPRFTGDLDILVRPDVEELEPFSTFSANSASRPTGSSQTIFSVESRIWRMWRR